VQCSVGQQRDESAGPCTPDRDPPPAGAIDEAGVDGVKHGAAPARVNKGQGAAGRPFIVHQLAVLVSQALLSFPRSGQCDDLGAGEVTVLDLEDTEGPTRLAPFVGG